MRFFIGDIHGCAREFEEMILKLKASYEAPEIYSVGDVINKGPDSIRCLELCQEHNIKAIRGNHEEMLLRLLIDPPNVLSEKELKLLTQFKGNEDLWGKVIDAWPLFFDFVDVTVVHAGLDPRESNLLDMNPRILTTIRTWDNRGVNLNRQGIDPAWFRVTKWDKPVIFGHWAQLGLMVRKKFVCLDSGCVYGKALSAWNPDLGQLIQVKSRKAYAKM